TSLVRPLEQEPEPVDRVTLKVLPDVDVDRLRGAGALVSEDVLDLLHRHTLAPQQRRAGVPQIVKPDASNAGRAAQLVEQAIDVPRLNRRTDMSREHVALRPGLRRLLPGSA